MTRRIPPWLWVTLAAVTIVILYVIGRANRPPAVIAPLRDSLQVLRVAADSCRAQLDRGTGLLHEYDERLDSLRARVRQLEAIDRRGVPADSYAVYLAVFEQYNDSVTGWTHRADTLRVRLERCRVVTQAHNLIADSLRRLLVQRQ